MLKRLSIEMKFKFQTHVEQKSFESRFEKSFFGANVFQKIIKHVEHNFDFNDLLLFSVRTKRKKNLLFFFKQNFVFLKMSLSCFPASFFLDVVLDVVLTTGIFFKNMTKNFINDKNDFPDKTNLKVLLTKVSATGCWIHFRTLKLSKIGTGQYLDGRLLGNSCCCR